MTRLVVAVASGRIYSWRLSKGGPGEPPTLEEPSILDLEVGIRAMTPGAAPYYYVVDGEGALRLLELTGREMVVRGEPHPGLPKLGQVGGASVAFVRVPFAPWIVWGADGAYHAVPILEPGKLALGEPSQLLACNAGGLLAWSDRMLGVCNSGGVRSFTFGGGTPEVEEAPFAMTPRELRAVDLAPFGDGLLVHGKAVHAYGILNSVTWYGPDGGLRGGVDVEATGLRDCARPYATEILPHPTIPHVAYALHGASFACTANHLSVVGVDEAGELAHLQSVLLPQTNSIGTTTAVVTPDGRWLIVPSHRDIRAHRIGDDGRLREQRVIGLVDRAISADIVVGAEPT